MAEKKSILEEALLDINKIQEALNANTKEILRSVAKEEINGVVKESLMDVKEEEYEEEDLDGGEETGLDLEPAGDETEMGLDTGSEDLGGIEGSEEVGPEMGPEMGMDTDVLGGDDMDMTASSDDEVIAIYKKLSGEDEIEIVGDEIHLNVSEPGEYVVKMNDGATGAEEVEPMGGLDLDGETEMGGEETGDVDYEIEMGDEEGEETEMGGEETGDFGGAEETGSEEEVAVDAAPEEEEEEEIDENLAHAKGYAGRQGQRMHGAAHLPEMVKEAQDAKKLVSETTVKYNNLLSEAKKLKQENEEFRSALREFRTKLVETVVFNSNLTYVVRILQEHSTTKAEKDNIINRFDNEVSNLVESKKLYKTIVNQLESRKPISESVESKIIKEVTTGSSKQLNESTAYVDPSTKRIIDLMKRVG
jgi:uncharacterized protein (DUF1697 family)